MRVGRLLLTAALVAGCASTPDAADPYLHDASYRRSELTRSLVNPANGYSQLRLAAYDTGAKGDWSLLPEWNPRVEVVALSELDAQGGVDPNAPLGPSARPLAIDEAARGDEAALLALGEDAFFRYPLELAPLAATAAASQGTFAGYGFWTDAERGAGGLVRAELADGSRTLAYTCATCHAAPRAGAFVVGVGNDQLDLGRLAADASSPDPTLVARLLLWGPGRVDVTTNEATEPVRIPDLRPVRWLTHLQADATVAQRDRATLAIRIETLIITTHDQVVRPPRAVALGLAAYVWSLAASLPSAAPETPLATQGQTVFQSTCARCHAPPALTGPPVPLAVVGTDPAIGLSPVRGTGMYRVPSLRGVSTRGALLHDDSLPGLSAMFDPARLDPGYTGGRHGAGAIVGHPFGLDLAEPDRTALLAYLGTL